MRRDGYCWVPEESDECKVFKIQTTERLIDKMIKKNILDAIIVVVKNENTIGSNRNFPYVFMIVYGSVSFKYVSNIHYNSNTRITTFLLDQDVELIEQ